MVVAITGGSPDMQGMLNVLWDKLYPAILDAPLEEDEQAHAALQQKLADFISNADRLTRPEDTS